MNTLDINYLEEKLAERPFKWEELYYEILDHVLCKYEASGIDNVEKFWEQEKLNWSWWKIFKLRIKFHNLMILKFLKCYFRSLFSLQKQNLKVNLVFLGFAIIFGFNFYQDEGLMKGLIMVLWFVFPVTFQTWVHYNGDTFGEKSKIFKNKRYGSAKRDALWSVVTANFFSWQIILTEGREYLDLDGFFSLAYHNPAITIPIIFLMLVSMRAIYQVFKTQLKPFLHEAR
ncbi:hypothetical protein MM239_02515 [Belliella sp. DSM 111904]|uniref:DUF3278 domain-containing protein n=1 Tax=Belliella filtrata TaxID=2923435 RepID=A0ABS9UVR8_9BACT|nr:hypothetical protein [Belliella filtrata]MCH7408254.1 hypothetical protein [Belliella filtrata]